ncbi:hypothetical protein LZ023_40465 (plasmid) [Pseudomonas silvicola]|nr:hypothetical protein LZ023_40465 [Pseudomonas silvicola]
MHAWDCLAGYCLVKEAGGWYHPFNTEGESFAERRSGTGGGPGAEADLKRIAEFKCCLLCREPLSLRGSRQTL